VWKYSEILFKDDELSWPIYYQGIFDALLLTFLVVRGCLFHSGGRFFVFVTVQFFFVSWRLVTLWLL